jgi:hypothetical protein
LAKNSDGIPEAVRSHWLRRAFSDRYFRGYEMATQANCARGNGPGPIVCSLLGAVVLTGGLAVCSERGWAKHKPDWQPSITGDPCASLNTYIQKHIAELKTLKTALEADKNGLPSTLEGVFERLEGKAVIDHEKIAKIAEMRREAEDVNSLLRAQGCKPVDIEQQLAKP